MISNPLSKHIAKKMAKNRSELEQKPVDMRRSETSDFLRKKRHFLNAA
jgi:hypothetical protein